MKGLWKVLTALFVALALYCAPAHAQFTPGLPHGYSAGPNDTSSAHDYARPVGKSSDKKLSTGWTHGKGARTEEVHDYYRKDKKGEETHVHGYYKSEGSSGGHHH